ncbi:hypothetical protein HPB51_007124 [Rhipicephalus microplus]|uniref:Uncharacterized protein n=1 Tax=Rhipicephalus microplus TaxID=6941 RepID=A0A9J6DZS3_RHIMP|nr:hypothetical protein HPB51_007124 [Rhipicephalus microplus]
MNLLLVPDAISMWRSDKDDAWLVRETHFDLCRAGLRASVPDISTFSETSDDAMHSLLSMGGVVGSNAGGRFASCRSPIATHRRWSRCERPRCPAKWRLIGPGPEERSRACPRAARSNVPATRAGIQCPTIVPAAATIDAVWSLVEHNRGRCTPAEIGASAVASPRCCATGPAGGQPPHHSCFFQRTVFTLVSLNTRAG